MAILLEKDLVGLDITEEQVSTWKEVVVADSTVYRGRVQATTSKIVYGQNEDYGVFSETSNANSQVTVNLSGTASSPSVVVWDTVNGFIYSSAPRTIYATYPAFMPLKFGPGSITVDLPWYYEANAEPAFEMQLSDDGIFRRAAVSWEEMTGNCSVIVEGSTGSQEIALSNTGSVTSISMDFTEPVKVTGEETIKVSVVMEAAANINQVKVVLYE